MHPIQYSKPVASHPDCSQTRGPLPFWSCEKDNNSVTLLWIHQPLNGQKLKKKAKTTRTNSENQSFITIRVLRVTLFGDRVQVVGAVFQVCRPLREEYSIAIIVGDAREVLVFFFKYEGLTLQSRTAFSAGLYDMLNTGNLDPLGHNILQYVTKAS